VKLGTGNHVMPLGGCDVPGSRISESDTLLHGVITFLTIFYFQILVKCAKRDGT